MHRQLTTAQRSVAAAKADNFREAAKERQKLSKGQGVKGPANLPDLKSDSRDEAGKAFGVSGKSVDSAAKEKRPHQTAPNERKRCYPNPNSPGE